MYKKSAKTKVYRNGVPRAIFDSPCGKLPKFHQNRKQNKKKATVIVIDNCAQSICPYLFTAAVKETNFKATKKQNKR